MTKFINTVKSFTADESGAVSSEYAVLLVLIAAGLVTAVIFLEDSISGAMNGVGTCITNGDGTGC
jgi:Flp pilus assembly pilin Flp